MAERQLLPESEDGGYKLTGMLDLDTVPGFKERGLMALEAAGDLVRFDLADAEIKGSAVIALLIALQREAVRINNRVEFINCPDTLLAIAELCDVANILQCGDKDGH